MSPSISESVSHRGRFVALFALLVSSTVAFAVTRPAPASVRDAYAKYEHYKPVGKCVDGRWVYR